MTPKRLLIESKRTLFSQKLTHDQYCNSQESCIAENNNNFFCISLVAHVYNTIIQVYPGLFVTFTMCCIDLYDQKCLGYMLLNPTTLFDF